MQRREETGVINPRESTDLHDEVRTVCHLEIHACVDKVWWGVVGGSFSEGEAASGHLILILHTVVAMLRAQP